MRKGVSSGIGGRTDFSLQFASSRVAASPRCSYKGCVYPAGSSGVCESHLGIKFPARTAKRAKEYPKSSSFGAHARERASQRYGVVLTDDLRLDILKKIHSGWSLGLKQNDERSIHIVNGLTVIYSKYNKDLVTVLPKKSKETFLVRNAHRAKILPMERNGDFFGISELSDTFFDQ